MVLDLVEGSSLGYGVTTKNLLISLHLVEDLLKQGQTLTAFKQHVILDYNKYKGAVDSLDRQVEEWTYSRITKLWPFLLFFHIVDLATINPFTFFPGKYQEYKKGKTFKMRSFLKDLGMALAKPHN